MNKDNFDKKNDVMFIDYVKDLKEYTKYSSYTKNIFSDPKIKLPEITKKLFFLFSNDETFNNTMNYLKTERK